MAEKDSAQHFTAPYDKKFKYHHGDLRSALIAAAQDILVSDGIEGLSLRNLAKATGVTQAAPYSHFKDKDDLLAIIAESGFQRLALQMADDAVGAASTRERVERLIESYIRFAIENKNMFQLMFGRELQDLKQYPTLGMTAGKSYALISAALAKLSERGEDVRFLTVAIWSLCHGLTSLLVNDRVSVASLGSKTLKEFVQKNVALFAAQLH